MTTPRQPMTHRDGESGASLIEYALLVALIALVCVAAVQFFGANLGARYSSTASSVATAGT